MGVCGELLILGKSVIRHTHVEHQTKVWSSNLRLLGRQSGREHGTESSGGGTLAACGKRDAHTASKATPHLYFDGASASSARSSGRKIPSDRRGSTHT